MHFFGRDSVQKLDVLSFDAVFQETSAQYRAVEPEQWLQRHPDVGSSWPSWPKASQHEQEDQRLDRPIGLSLFLRILQGFLAHKKTPTPLGPPRTLGTGLR